MLRKVVAADEKIYKETLKISRGEETIDIFKNIPFREKAIKE